MSVRVKVDVTAAVQGLHELEKQHIPFALAATLTKVVKGAQGEVQGQLPSKFTLRNDFTQKGIRIKPAEKKSAVIEADVHTDTANRKTGAPDYLGKQEEGGERVAFGGHSHIAIPTKYLRQMIGASSPIPAELRPKALLSAVNGRYTTTIERKDWGKDSSGRYKRQTVARNQVTVRGMVFFVQQSRSGTPMIMGRYWTDHEAYPFYILARSVRTKPRLAMDKTVDTYAQQNFQKAWDEQWSAMRAKGLRFR